MPPAIVRGDLARCLFYMAVRYDGTDAITMDLELSSSPCIEGAAMGNLTTLLRWLTEDPASVVERARNNGVCVRYQQNRNPFVEFVAKIWPCNCYDHAVRPSEAPVRLQHRRLRQR